MNTKTISLLIALVCALALVGAAQAQEPEEPDLDCRLVYDISGWSLIYKYSAGTGTVSCNGGQTMPVKLSANAIGLTAGRWKIDNGSGNFTGVKDIREVLGNYAQASASAGLSKAGEAQVLTKGTVSLALAGSGSGVNLGVDIGQFKIEAVDDD